MNVTVVVPTYKDWDRLTLCLKSLVNQTYEKGIIEIIVVNNDTVEETPSLIKRFKNVIFLNEDKPGSYAARNRAICSASGDFLFFTDSDCIPSESWIETGLNFFNTNKEVHYIGGRIDLIYDDSSYLARLYEHSFAFRQEEIVSGKRFTVTANMAIRKNLINEVGLFNEGLLSGGDQEWGSRAWRLGHKVKYVENMLVYHPARKSLFEIYKKQMRIFGGQYENNRNESYIYLIIIVGFLPPLHKTKAISVKSNVNFFEKIILFFMLYARRILRSCSFLIYKFNLKDLPRS